MAKHIINIGVCHTIDGKWVALCDNYEAETDAMDRFMFRILSPGWRFDTEAAAPSDPTYPPLVSPRDHPSYTPAHGWTHSGIWVDDPSASIEVVIRGNNAITLSHKGGHGIDRHQYAVCLIDGSTPPNRCVLDPYLKDKPRT